MEGDDRYELRGWELYLNGERLPVSAAVVRAVIARRARERAINLPTDGRIATRIDLETARRILRMERILAISHLAALLKEKAA